jgi:hypothetical protein
MCSSSGRTFLHGDEQMMFETRRRHEELDKTLI